MQVRVKICGVTRPEDALAAEAAGADAIGMIVHARSARRIDLAAAERVVAALGPFVQRVGVFQDAPTALILEAVGHLGLDVVQLHGDEAPEVAADLRTRVRVVKAVRYDPGLDIAALARYPADAVLVDGPRPGSGEAFAWAEAEAVRALPRLILAGGLTPANVAEAVRRFGPYAVDVASGVESTPGVKDPEAVRRFVVAAKSAR